MQAYRNLRNIRVGKSNRFYDSIIFVVNFFIIELDAIERDRIGFVGHPL